MARVFLKEITMPAIAAGVQQLVEIGNRKLSESTLQKSLPALGVSILNESSNSIKVFVNEEPTNAFRVSPNASRGLSGVPFTDLSIENLGTTEIAEAEVTVTLINDFEQCRRYDEAKNKGYTIL